MQNATQDSLRSDVIDGQRLTSAIFRDTSIYEREKHQVFSKNWLVLGHESQLPKHGSFVRTYMGEEPIILARDKQGEIRAHLNLCRHRAFEVCQEDHGTTERFQCPYHGWTYGVDGALLGVPGFRELYYGELDRGKHGLVPVPRVEFYKGLIFGNFDPDAEALSEHLGDMAWYLDTILDRREGGTELLGVQRWRIPANWKVVCENHCGDEYHIGFAHGSNFYGSDADFEGLVDQNQAMPLPLAREVCPKPGHGMGINIFPEDMSETDVAFAAANAHEGLAKYLESIRSEMEDRLGKERSRIFALHGLVYPNFGMVPTLNSVRVVHPRGPAHVEMWGYCIVDKAASPEVKAMMKTAAMATFGPSGTFEQDDSNNWASVTRTGARPISQKVQMNLQMGMGHETTHRSLPGKFGLTASEINQRNFYQRWADDMNQEVAQDGC